MYDIASLFDGLAQIIGEAVHEAIVLTMLAAGITGLILLTAAFIVPRALAWRRRKGARPQ